MSLILFLRRLVKVLRADTAPHQIGLGLLLGTLVGLPPLGPATLAFVFLFLVLNANLGAFLAGTVVAKFAGILLAPTLEAFGRGILDAEAARGLWLSVLNLPCMAICGFDRYDRFGATVAALGIGIVLFLLSLLFVRRIRVAIVQRIEASPRLASFVDKGWVGFVNRLLFGKRKRALDEIEGGGLIRRGFVIPFGIAVVGVWVAWTVVGDEVTRRGIQAAASGVSGKNVELARASLSFLGGSLGIGDMDVTERGDVEDPEIAQGQRIVLDMSPFALLDRRLVVDELAVENLTVYGAVERLEEAGGEPSPVPVPPEPPVEGDPVGLEDVVEWVEAHEKQLTWLLDRVDEMLRPSPGEAPEGPGKTEKKKSGRAEWVYASRTRPAFTASEAAIRHLRFDWRDAEGPWTALEELDLALRGLSSHPWLHDRPIELEAKGLLGGKELSLIGSLDAREESTAGHSLAIRLASSEFSAARSLGIEQGEDLGVDITLAMDRGTRSLRTARVEGTFRAPATGLVRFAVAGGGSGAREIEADLGAIDLTAAGFALPRAIRAERGTIRLGARFAEDGGRLSGGLDVAAEGLQLAPGSRGELAGLDASVVCRGLNALTKETPLELAFELGGTTGSPSVALDDTALANLLQQVKAGLLIEGERRLAAQVDRRLGPLRDRVDKQLNARLGQDLEGVLEDPEALLGAAASSLLEDPGKVLEDPGKILGGKGGEDKIRKAGGRLEKELEKGLGGLLGGRKKKKDGDGSKDPPKKKDPPER